MYVPALRWRQGEYQALFRLATAAKDRIVPYITIPEVEFDFELWQPKKTVQEHVHPFPARFNAKWGHPLPGWAYIQALRIRRWTMVGTFSRTCSKHYGSFRRMRCRLYLLTLLLTLSRLSERLSRLMGLEPPLRSGLSI
jgi:hypothetical protein